MAQTRWRAITLTTLGIALFALAWILGALAFFTASEGAWSAIVPAGLLLAVVIGIALVRRSARGYLLLGLTGVASAAWVFPWVLEGGVFSTLIVVAGLVVAMSALVAWRLPPARERPAAGRLPVDRTYIERCLAWSLGIGGGLLLARAALELVRGLVELPGASEHMAGDVLLWLFFVLPIPIILGAVAVATALALTRRRTGTGTATLALTTLVVASLAWMAMWSASHGGIIRPFDDPLLWPSIAALAGTAAGIVAASVEYGRVLHAPRPPHAPRAHPS